MIQPLLTLLAALAPFQDPAPATAPSAEELAAWRAAAAWSEERGGLALLVRRGGAVAFEQYGPGHGPDKAYLLASASQAFWGVAAAAAVGDGLLELDERVAATIEEWRGVAGKDEITVRQLLAMTSGLDATARRLRARGTTDHYEAAIEVKVLDRPGERFRFGPAHWLVFGALLERKLGADQDALAYLERRVLAPLGLEVGHWARDEAGRPQMSDGAYLTARQWSKLGELVLARGRVGERQLIEPAHLEACLRPSGADGRYGLGFWLFAGLTEVETDARGGAQEPAPLQPDSQSAQDLPEDVVFAAGFGHQRLYVMASRGLVVVRQGLPAEGWSDVTFLRLLLGLDRPGEDAPGEDG